MTTSNQQPNPHGTDPAYLSSDTAADPAAGTRAVVTITEQTGTTRAFRSNWAAPEHLIPLVADFVTWVDEGQHRLITQTWLAYADAFPATLPQQEVTGTEAADDTYIGDLDYRYQLHLHEDSVAILLRVYQLRELGPEPRPQLIFELTRANLFAQAAGLCDMMADRAQRWADRHGGNPPPGNDPDAWRRHEARFRRIHASTPVAAFGANLATQFTPATFNVPHPSIQVAGVWVFVYIDQHGTMRISAHLDEAEPWLLRRNRTVPMQVTIQDTVVFQG